MPDKKNKTLDKLNVKFNLYILIIILLCIVLCIYDARLIIPSILLWIFLWGYTIWMNDKKRLELVNHIQEITSDVNVATKNNLINSPIPLLLVETDGAIIWKSKSFVDAFREVDVITYLTPIIKEIKLNIENDEEQLKKSKYITKQFNIEKKFYKIIIFQKIIFSLLVIQNIF